jgi:hypothetical protein
MPLVQVRHRRGEEDLEIVGRGLIAPHDAGLIANRAAIEPAGMTSLQAALRRHETWQGHIGDIVITDDAEGQIDDESNIDPTRLVYEGQRLLAQTFAAVFDEEPDETLVRGLIGPILERERMQIAEIILSREKWGWGIDLTLEVPLRGQTVAESLRRADAVREMIETAYAQEFDVGAATSLIRAGHPELLIGMFENEWLDAKRVPYRLDLPTERYELAKDVAAFANANGGLVLIGVKTKGRPEGDEIRSVNECVLADVSLREWRSLIDKRVHPRIEGLLIERIERSTAERGVVLVQVPSQADRHKPFLVLGTRDGNQVSELGFTYAVRDGDGTRAPRIEVVHQLIRAGQAALDSNDALGQVEDIRSDIERLELATWEDWLRDIVLAAASVGFEVIRDGEFVIFRRDSLPELKIQTTTVGPPVDMLQRQNLLEKLATMGLPVDINRRGFLSPQQQAGDSSASASS